MGCQEISYLVTLRNFVNHLTNFKLFKYPFFTLLFIYELNYTGKRLIDVKNKNIFDFT